MTIKKIITGGQTGTDQGALDAAIGCRFDHGGWIPSGRGAEAGFLDPERYGLTVMESAGYHNTAMCREHNVMTADGVLILSWGELSGTPAMIHRLAEKHKKSFFHLDLATTAPAAATGEIYRWACLHGFRVLAVSGPRECRHTDIREAALQVVEGVLRRVREGEEKQPDGVADSLELGGESGDRPQTVDEAVAILLEKMSLKDKSTIANMSAAELPRLDASIGAYIRRAFDLQDPSNPLLPACAFTAGKTSMNEAEACGVILQELAYRLHRTHRLRVVK